MHAYQRSFIDFALARGALRKAREVCTERDLLQAHGTFYELPALNALGAVRLRPIATSGRADSSRRGHARGCRPTMSRALTTATSGSHPSYAGPRPSGKATNAITRPARASVLRAISCMISGVGCSSGRQLMLMW